MKDKKLLYGEQIFDPESVYFSGENLLTTVDSYAVDGLRGSDED